MLIVTDGELSKQRAEFIALVEEAFNRQDYENVLKKSKEFLDIYPHEPRLLLLAGHSARASANLAQAWMFYKTLVCTFPGNNSYLQLAQDLAPSEKDKKEISEVSERLAAAIKNFPTKPALQLVSNPVGKMVVPVYPDYDLIATEIKRGRIYDLNIIEEARKYIRAGTACIDIGANFGQMSLIFSKLVGESGIVYSVEADDYCQHIIENNISLNSIDNISLIKAAAHKVANHQVIFPDQDFNDFGTYGSYGICPKSLEGRAVNTITIDSLNIPIAVSFMKVDIQGADLWAMQGAVETIHKYKFPIIFEYEEQFQKNFDTSFDDYVNFVKDISYKFIKTVDAINFLIVPR